MITNDWFIWKFLPERNPLWHNLNVSIQSEQKIIRKIREFSRSDCKQQVRRHKCQRHPKSPTSCVDILYVYAFCKHNLRVSILRRRYRCICTTSFQFSTSNHSNQWPRATTGNLIIHVVANGERRLRRPWKIDTKFAKESSIICIWCTRIRCLEIRRTYYLLVAAWTSQNFRGQNVTQSTFSPLLIAPAPLQLWLIGLFLYNRKP